MTVRVLGCSGAIAEGCKTSSFLLDDDVLIDALYSYLAMQACVAEHPTASH